MSRVYNIQSRDRAPLLYRLEDGRYQIMEKLALTPLMQGHEYILVDRELATAIRRLIPSDVVIADAVVFNPQDNSELHTHQRLEILNQFSPYEIGSVSLSGKRMVSVAGQSIVVSNDLKLDLEQLGFPDLDFEEGPGMFGGAT